MSLKGVTYCPFIRQSIAPLWVQFLSICILCQRLASRHTFFKHPQKYSFFFIPGGGYSVFLDWEILIKNSWGKISLSNPIFGTTEAWFGISTSGHIPGILPQQQKYLFACLSANCTLFSRWQVHPQCEHPHQTRIGEQLWPCRKCWSGNNLLVRYNILTALNSGVMFGNFSQKQDSWDSGSLWIGSLSCSRWCPLCKTVYLEKGKHQISTKEGNALRDLFWNASQMLLLCSPLTSHL